MFDKPVWPFEKVHSCPMFIEQPVMSANDTTTYVRIYGLVNVFTKNVRTFSSLDVRLGYIYVYIYNSLLLLERLY
jgi:hypothetical protein